jgi:hypothetical protein
MGLKTRGIYVVFKLLHVLVMPGSLLIVKEGIKNSSPGNGRWPFLELLRDGNPVKFSDSKGYGQADGFFICLLHGFF